MGINHRAKTDQKTIMAFSGARLHVWQPRRSKLEKEIAEIVIRLAP